MNVLDAANKLAKWRTVFAGWQLGTRDKDDPECQAVRDHRETTMLLRAEVTTLTRILLEANIIKKEELAQIMTEEMQYLDKAYEKKFPGFTTSLDGVHMDIQKCAETTRGWRP